MAAGVGVAIGAGRKDSFQGHADEEINYKTFDFETSTAHRTSGSNNYTTAKTYTHFVTGDTATSGGDCVNPSGSISGYNYMARMKSSHKSDTLTLGPISKTVSSTAYKTSKITYDIKGPTAVSVQPSYSTDGSTFTNIGSAQSFATSTTNKTATINASGVSMDDFYIRFTVSYSGSSSSNQDSRIDNIKLYGFAEAPAKTLSSIALSGSYPTSFTQGDAFSHSGMTVTATYDDTTTADVTSSATFSGYNMSSTGAQTVTVSYTESGTTKTTTYSITVNAPSKTLSSIAITTPPTKTSYQVGETFDSTGMVVTASFSDSSSSTVQGSCTFSPSGALSISDTEITVSYTYGGTTKTATQSITVTAPSSVTFTAGTDVGTATAAGQEGTITKDGISFYCSSIRNHDAPYRLYKDSTVTFTSTIGNMAKIEFSGSSSDKISNMGSATTGTLVTDSTNNKSTWTGDASSVSFTMTAQGRADTIVVTLASTDPLVELAAGSATSVSMMRGDSDTSVKVHVANIASKTWTYTFDENEDEGLSTSSYINVSAGAAVDDVHTLTITTKAVGSTVLHIAVSGTACATTIPVTVAAKPASMMVTESDHETQITTLELQAGGSTKQVYWIGEDTEDNPYSIAASQVNGEIISGGSYVSISSGAGTVITPVAAGTAVIRYSLKVLSSVYAEITVNVVNDYKTTVNEITFNSNLSDTQGNAVDTSEVFSTRVADTHFGSTEVISDSELLFSYENNRNSAEAINVFSYDFSHGTTVDSTHKTQTVYVFTTFDTSYSGNFTITIEQKNDPLTAITITNVTNNELELSRGGEFQLEIGYTPANPTDGKEVVYRVDECDSGVSISVSSSGLISVSESSGLGAALIVVESAHDDTIYDWVDVSVTLESMSYQINETESWSVASSLSVGDRVVIAGTHSETDYELTGVTSNVGQVASFDSDPAGTFTLTVGEGNTENSFTFSNGTSYLAYTLSATSGSNYLHTISNPSTNDQLNQVSWTVSISDGTATITNVYNTNRKILLNYNNGSPRFCAYTSAPSTTMHLPAIYKLTGGLSSKNVDETLFNGVHNNFGAGKTYAWDEVCSSFNSGNWSSAGTALKGISGFANYKLERAVGDINGNEIEQFIAKYDIIIGKFSTADDFLGRFSAGGINYGSARVVPMINIVGNTNTVAIIVIISMVSVTAIGGYFFIRKRKEN
jgi:hypothetical protein